MIKYGKQDISDSDIKAVENVLKSDFLTQGPAIERFEDALCKLTGATFSSVLTNATSALHLACLALGLGPGDRLWTSPVSFVASSNVGIYCGAKVDFVDIDPVTFNMCPQKLLKKLEEAEIKGTLPKVLVPVHLCGLSCDMKLIKDICDKYGIRIIEDASHAIGGIYAGEAIGSCKYSDVTVFSFHPVKIITTGEGGAVLTNDINIIENIRLLRSHGVTRDASKFKFKNHGPWYYEQQALGFNYRMTDIQAALGLSQLERLEEFINIRHRIAAIYNDNLVNLPIRLPIISSTLAKSALHLYVIQLESEQLKSSKKKIFHSLLEAGISLNVHYIPIHTHPYYQDLGFKIGDFPIAEDYYNRALSLPMHPGLSDNDIDLVLSTIKQSLN